MMAGPSGSQPQVLMRKRAPSRAQLALSTESPAMAMPHASRMAESAHKIFPRDVMTAFSSDSFARPLGLTEFGPVIGHAAPA